MDLLMNKEISLEKILSKLENIERLLCDLQTAPSVDPKLPPSSFLPGGKDWFLMASDEERQAYNRKRGQSTRRGKK